MSAKQNASDLPFWVGVVKGKYRGHEVFQHRRPTEKTHPNYDYVIGPFTGPEAKKKARERAAKETNKTGFFTDPFCNNGGGR